MWSDQTELWLSEVPGTFYKIKLAYIYTVCFQHFYKKNWHICWRSVQECCNVLSTSWHGAEMDSRWVQQYTRAANICILLSGRLYQLLVSYLELHSTKQGKISIIRVFSNLFIRTWKDWLIFRALSADSRKVGSSEYTNVYGFFPLWAKLMFLVWITCPYLFLPTHNHDHSIK